MDVTDTRQADTSVQGMRADSSGATLFGQSAGSQSNWGPYTETSGEHFVVHPISHADHA